MNIWVLDTESLRGEALVETLRSLGHGAIPFASIEQFSLSPADADLAIYSAQDITDPADVRRLRNRLGSTGYLLAAVQRSSLSSHLSPATVEATKAGGDLNESPQSEKSPVFPNHADDVLLLPLDPLELELRLGAARRRIQRSRDMVGEQEELGLVRDDLLDANLRLIQAQEIAELARSRSVRMFEDLPIACFTIDLHGRVYEWNARAESLFGIAPHVALGQSFWELLPELGTDKARTSLQNVFLGKSFADHPWTLYSKHLLVSSHPLLGNKGEIVGALTSVVDVTALRDAERQIERQKEDLVALNSQLQTLAITDGLTGVPNRRAFQEHLVSALQSAHSHAVPFVLAMVDIDHFKRLNDTYGHQAGDEVLCRVANTLTAGLRRSDFVGRYGGEEFVIILEGANVDIGLRLMERLRASIESMESDCGQVTASFGLTICDGTELDGNTLVKQADTALYEAKNSGRNCVVNYADIAEAQKAA